MVFKKFKLKRELYISICQIIDNNIVQGMILNYLPPSHDPKDKGPAGKGTAESVMCDVINISLKEKDESRSGKGNP